MKSAISSLLKRAALAATMSGLLLSSHSALSGTMPPATLPHQVQRGYGKLPLAFEANRGQTDARVQFLSRGTGYSVFLTSGGMVLQLRPTDSITPPTDTSSAKPGAIASKGLGANKTVPGKPADTTMFFNLVGAASSPAAVGEDPLPTKVNYFIGNDPKKWRTNVRTYAKVRYQNVYPGIDLVYYGSNRQVEYDFDVAPGADANQIQFSVTGADSLNVDAQGNLVLTKGTNQLHFQAPNIYQEVAGFRLKVVGSYSLKDSTHVGFTVAPHDSSKTLVIDPVLVYSTFLGGRGDDQANAIVVDSIGNAYVTGTTDSPDFPLANLGGFNPDQTRMFVTKLDVSGSALLYADYFGGTSGDDYPYSIAVDSNGNAYVTGLAYSSDFSVLNAYQPNLAGYANAFLTKFSADGSSLVYSTFLGGSNFDFAQALAVDSAGEATIAGYATSTNFPLANAFQSSIAPDENNIWGVYSFFSRFSADGSSLIYSSYLAGNLDAQFCYGDGCGPYSDITGLGLDGSGNLYIAGNTNTFNFPITPGAYMTTNPGSNNNYEPFVSKFDTSGGIVYSSYFGGNGYAQASAIAVDSNGGAYITGYDQGNDNFPITATTICNPNTQSCSGMFVTKFDSAGATLVYSTYLGQNNNSSGVSIQVDASGDAYVIGSDGSSGQYAPVNPIEGYIGGQDILLMEIDPLASTQLFATYLGGGVYDDPAGLALDSNGAIYVTGGTQSQFFPVTQSAFQSSWGGETDAFILKIGPANAPAVTIAPSLLQFSTMNVGVTSSPLSTILRNMGTAALTITSKTVAGDFAETDDCGTSVAPGSFCTFSVTFTPTEPGSRFGSILLGDDADGSPHFINLVGDGSAPIVTVSPQSLTFSSVPVGQTSPAQTVTLLNTGNATLDISSITTSANFAETNNCSPALAIGTSCQIQVTVTPPAGGLVTGTLTLTDNAPGGMQTLALSGSGYVTTATFTPSALTFGVTAVGSISSPQVVTVTNTGNSAMIVSGVTASTQFAATTNCSTVPPSGTCSISVSFAPTAAGAQSGNLTINDNAQGNPHSVAVSGTGIAGVASISPSSLTFAAATVGTTSTPQTITVSNTGNGPLTFSGVQSTGDFAIVNNNCNSVAASATCTLQVTFTATASGTRTGTVTFTDSAANSPQFVNLTGSGIDFSMPASGGSATIMPGSTATYTLSIASVGGTFSSQVNLACEGVPAFSVCTANPTSVDPGAGSASITVTIKTTGTTAMLSDHPGVAPRPMFASWTLTTGFGLFGTFLLGTGGKRKRMGILLLAIVMIAGLLVCVGCGTISGSQTQTGTSTPAGTYTVLVIGTSGSVQHFSSLTLVVQ
jgi:hypothetical protein